MGDKGVFGIFFYWKHSINRLTSWGVTKKDRKSKKNQKNLTPLVVRCIKFDKVPIYDV